MAQVEVPLTDEQMAALEALAKRRHMSVAELVRGEVASLARLGKAPVDRERRRRALAVAGRFRSREGDLADHHDRYFAEAAEE